MSTPRNVISTRPGDTPLDYHQENHTLRYRRRPDGGFTPQYLLCEGTLANNSGVRKFRCRHGFVTIVSDENGDPTMDFQAPASPRNKRPPANRPYFPGGRRPQHR